MTPRPDLPLDPPTVDGLRAGCETLKDLSVSGVPVESRMLLALLDVYEAAIDYAAVGPVGDDREVREASYALTEAIDRAREGEVADASS